MVKIANDTPKELLNLAKRLKFSGNKEEVGKKAIELKNLAVKYVPVRPNTAPKMEIEMDGKFQPLANLISILDFSKVPNFSKKMGLAYIENYLKQQGFLR
jgi:hypothetical protein